MKNEEAKDLLMNASGSVETITALSIAVGALNKQIQRKPYIRTTDQRESGMSKYGCSICCTSLGSTRFGFNYCPSCGQAIDWSEE